MVDGTRKNAALKQPSRVSFVDCSVLRCLHLRSPGPRANASGNGTWSPHSCTVLSGIGQALCILIHSARWPADTDLSGQDVVAVGSGCIAAQIVPALLQTPVNVSNPDYANSPMGCSATRRTRWKEAHAKWAPQVYETVPSLRLLVRMLLCFVAESHWLFFKRNNYKSQKQAEASSLAHMTAQAPLQYHCMLTPRYPVGCKRPIWDSDWLKSMHDSRFSLVSGSLARVHDLEVTVLGNDQTPGKELLETTLKADTLILAAGYNVNEFKHYVPVIFRNGTSLHDQWATRGGPHAYMCTAIDGFHNFMVGGPNTLTGHTSAIITIENNIEYILRLIKPVLTGHVSVDEPKPEAVQAWDRGIQGATNATVFRDCTSWYTGQGGRNVAVYPRSQLDYYLRCRFPRLSD
ncbi:hypothetical protein BBP40_006923 [Aspergillus hancockii]|nr:hypothetical protein BBP40_006923 [Aspergillus hancockii]